MKLYISNRILYISNRILYISNRILYISNRILYISNRILYISNRILYISNRILYISNRILYISNRILYISNRPSEKIKKYPSLCQLLTAHLLFRIYGTEFNWFLLPTPPAQIWDTYSNPFLIFSFKSEVQIWTDGR